jgi:hypothetical protein
MGLLRRLEGKLRKVFDSLPAQKNGDGHLELRHVETQGLDPSLLLAKLKGGALNLILQSEHIAEGAPNLLTPAHQTYP